MYWTRSQLAEWFEALVAGLIDRDRRLVRGDGRPRRLRVNTVWEYLDSAGLVGSDEFDAFAGSAAGRAAIVYLWHSAREEFERWLGGSPLAVEMDTPWGFGVLSIHDFRPGADVYEYYQEEAERSNIWGGDGVVAVFETSGVALRCEVTGEFRVEWRGKVYENEPVPRSLVRLLKEGRVKPALNPWFALRFEKNGYVDDVFGDHILPGSYWGLRQLFLKAAEAVQRRPEGAPVL
ncbi:hypothetical protein V3F56_06225 [Moorellaceae bacterium AZ2]